MSLIVIDQGNRIQTPLKTLFKPRGVEQAGEARSSDGLPNSDDPTQPSGKRSFLRILEGDSGQRRSASNTGAHTAYEEASKAGKPKQRPTLKAQQIMTFPVQTVSISVSLRQAWLQMQEYSIAHLIVVDEDEKPIGLLSKEDILEHGTDSTVTIAVVYQRQMIAAAVDTELSQIASVFVNYPVGALPVLGNRNELLGIISRTDLVRLLINDAQVESWA